LKKNIVFIIAILSIVVLLAGCAASVPTPSPTPQPSTASLTVLSSDYYCYGYVWVNGLSTGKYLDFNGSVVISGLTPGTTTSVQLRDQYGFSSHMEYIVLQPGSNNMVNFTYWL
jgi:hypothetical protein